VFLLLIFASCAFSAIALNHADYIIGKTKLNHTLEVHRYTTGSNKINVFYIANQHGEETKSSKMAEGFEAAVKNNTKYTERFNTWIIPVSNPDGVHLNTQNNYYNQNTNRFWNITTCYETNKIKGAINDVKNITIFIDNHALNSGENYSYIYIRTKSDISQTKKDQICKAMNTYLSSFKCNFEKVSSTDNQDKAAYYMANKAKYTILIEVSQSNTSDKTAKQLGENLTRFIGAIV
jgi:hypothetical protein